MENKFTSYLAAHVTDGRATVDPISLSNDLWLPGDAFSKLWLPSERWVPCTVPNGLWTRTNAEPYILRLLFDKNLCFVL